MPNASAWKEHPRLILEWMYQEKFFSGIKNHTAGSRLARFSVGASSFLLPISNIRYYNHSLKKHNHAILVDFYIYPA